MKKVHIFYNKDWKIITGNSIKITTFINKLQKGINECLKINTTEKTKKACFGKKKYA